MQAFVPVGLLSLKASCHAACPSAAVDVVEVNTLINAGQIQNSKDFYDDLADAIVGAGTDLVGLMTDSDSLHHTVAIASRVKARAPRAIVGLGGPASSPLARPLLQRFEAIDFVVRGEGEETFAEAICALERGVTLSGIAGLTWRDRLDVAHNTDRKVIEDLDTLPIPDFAAYSGIRDAALYLDVGRGCPFKCSFCATAPFWERRYRMKSIPRIQEEIWLLRDRWGRGHVNFSHDIFTCDAKWTHRFCDAMKSAELGVTWSCSTRTDVIDPELLAHMAEAGCVEIYYGIETGSQAMQAVIDKDLDLARSRDIVRATASVGIRPVTGFILGYPEETPESASDTLTRFFDFLEVGGYRAHIFTLCPFPGAPMFARAQELIGRRSECLELPLAAEAAAEADRTISENPHIFVGHFRYATAGISSELVAAVEEISPHLVLLKRLWPMLLPHYDAPMTLLMRWTHWIAERNAERPWRGRHHGDAGDLIDFLARELAELGIADGRLGELLRYEAVKLAAAALPANSLDDTERPTQVSSDTILGQARHYLIAAFAVDIGGLIAGHAQPANDVVLPQWVLFARGSSGAVDTMMISDRARRILECAQRPRKAGELARAALIDAAGRGGGPTECGLDTVHALLERRLLKEVIPS
ncbi:B12-binding domain-containing radical SAM protein [Mesorhizobium huakuii]|uniref:B12-binding domain-containing radical SAM protein n=1 Tax=Mesorhizobium huakuii TaxID=28104 RepID=A0A7G6T520_9HYPH|nr:radical SAM protein [Mesorhizobium huakuii]QND61852.1 B12-binding domain-containing radical SAM protein [Mesorhizobium huakuii]QND69055.1 B12-binding domain-containing radical SAM protein [Mesorhizobium loti]